MISGSMHSVGLAFGWRLFFFTSKLLDGSPITEQRYRRSMKLIASIVDKCFHPFARFHTSLMQLRARWTKAFVVSDVVQHRCGMLCADY